MTSKPTLLLLTMTVLPVAFGLTPARSPASNPFFIVFGSGFTQDTVSVVLNKVQVLQNVVLNTDPVSGTSRQASLYYQGDTLYTVDRSGAVRNRQQFSRTPTLSLLLVVNGRSTSLTAQVKKGKFLLLTKWPTDSRIVLAQFKRPIQVE
jgi:hypothetical protein